MEAEAVATGPVPGYLGAAARVRLPDRHHGLAAYLATGERGECLGSLSPVEYQADARAQAAVGDQAGQDGEVLALGFLGNGADEADDPGVPGLTIEIADADLAGAVADPAIHREGRAGCHPVHAHDIGRPVRLPVFPFINK